MLTIACPTEGEGASMARSKSRDTLVSEIAALTKKLREHDKAEAERIGNIALKAGLGSINITDEALAREFEAIVTRFRAEHPEVAESKGKRSRSLGPAQEGADDQAA
jgi:antirestriction protein